MAVLVNSNTASASEIIAACLQDHHRATVVGERTFGQGLVKSLIKLEGGKSALKLTTATYTRPNGHNIHRFPDAKESDEWGVKPNPGYEVKLNIDEMNDLITDRRRRDLVLTSNPTTGEQGASDISDAKTEEKTAQKKTPPDKQVAGFTDRQLQKGFDFLLTELARAK